jgi:uncharacterized protein
MSWKNEWKKLALATGVFVACFYLPIGESRFDNALLEAFQLLKWYAQEHVILCLIPAFFIAGAISVFISQASVMKYLGARANKVLAYGVASVSGSVLAVCSCTVLPLFAGIKKMGAGLGPATTFLYSGPAINILAIVLTANVLGMELGIGRAIGAIVFSIIIGLIMHFLFRNEEEKNAETQMLEIEPEVTRPLWKNGLYFASMAAILVFANWAKPDTADGIWPLIYQYKWIITSVFAASLALILVLWFNIAASNMLLTAGAVLVLALLFPNEVMIPFSAGFIGLSIIISFDSGEGGEWMDASWGFAKQILPLLLFGVLIAGVMLGRPGNEGLIPSEWITQSVGGNSFFANFFASFAGAFMYFATLTEIPILQGLLGSGMGQGPALALLLAGPALSLPNMLVIRSVMGTKKTLTFVTIVIIMSTISGMIFGAIVG